MIPIINRLFFARGREFMINSVIFDIDDKTNKVIKIERIVKNVN